MYLAAIAATSSMRALLLAYRALLPCSFLLTGNLFDGAGYFADTPLNFLQSYLLIGALLLLVLLYRLRHQELRAGVFRAGSAD